MSVGAGESTLLDVRDLNVRFNTRDGVVQAVSDLSFSLRRGETLGVVGESGSGKSITGFSLLGLVDPPGRIAAGSIRLMGQELVGMPRRELRKLRGKVISMVFQDPAMTLNPVLSVRRQMRLALAAHEHLKFVGVACRYRGDGEVSVGRAKCPSLSNTDLILRSTEDAASCGLLFQHLLLMCIGKTNLDEVLFAAGLGHRSVVELLDNLVADVARLEAKDGQ